MRASLVLLLAAGGVLSVTAAACGSDANTEDALDGRSFLLESSQGFERVVGTSVRLTFRMGELGFSAGCNSHSGSFELKDDRLILQSLASTEIGCDPALHAQDDRLAEFMSARPLLRLEGMQLILSGSHSTLIFLDREVADPDRPLVGSAWSIDTFIDAGAATNIPVGSPPTLRFDDDGSLSANTGCNTGSGRYTVAGDRLTLANVSFTDAACSGPSAFADTRMRTVLTDGEVRFEIEAARLTLMRGATGLGARAP